MKTKTLVLFPSQVTNPLLIMIYNILCVAFLDMVPALRKTRVKLTVEGDNCMMGRFRESHHEVRDVGENHPTNDLGSSVPATVGRNSELRQRKGHFSGNLEAKSALQTILNSRLTYI